MPSAPASRIPHSRPCFSVEDRQAVLDVLDRAHPAAGPVVERFEKSLGTACGRPFATATSSGTAALHLALLALGARAGTPVAFPSYVCAAVLHAIRYTGADPVPLDVDPRTGNLPGTPVRGARILVVPHLFGLPAPVADLSQGGADLVEDCAMCLGTSASGRPVGSWGRLSIASTYATKMIATGHGGAALTDDPALAEFLRDRVRYDEQPRDAVRYAYRMSDLAAALGCGQVARLGAFVRARRERAEAYRLRLAGGPWDLPPSDATHAYHRFVLSVRGGAEDLIGRARTEGIEMKRPVYLPAHRYLGLPDKQFPGASEAWERNVSIPIYPDLTPAEQDRVIACLLDWAKSRE
ncbi:MAG: DegT/DnrJ/EryC1/StrS aminotransferase family protein [Planctomycetes bacterium]|nr:DegT/DnrJ/EryC1/StrS aminotransferase family protein [Planctomycetota bacterium]